MLKSNLGWLPILLSSCLFGLAGCASDQQIVRYNVRSSGSTQRSVGTFEYLDEDGKLVVKQRQLLSFVKEIKVRKGQKFMLLVQGMFPQNKYEVEISTGKDRESLESACRVQATGNRQIAVCEGKIGDFKGFIRQD